MLCSYSQLHFDKAIYITHVLLLICLSKVLGAWEHTTSVLSFNERIELKLGKNSRNKFISKMACVILFNIILLRESLAKSCAYLKVRGEIDKGLLCKGQTELTVAKDTKNTILYSLSIFCFTIFWRMIYLAFEPNSDSKNKKRKKIMTMKKSMTFNNIVRRSIEQHTFAG